jgi:hypothetical protein
MSAFLGKIHYMLYNKIQLQEDILEGIEKFAKEKGIPTEDIIAKINNEYGYPERGPLENAINHDNIHGWLQSKIQSVESRTAALFTELKESYKVKTEELSGIFYNNGKAARQNLDDYDYSPEDMFVLIYNHLLEGMPCDRINETVSGSEDQYVWKTTRCIHTEAWNSAKGDINDFYLLRDSWIKGFLEAGTVKFSYTRTSEGLNKITKVV